ncbi:hypothetical protein IWQ60_002081 [Tieghemiomyces parasiticus]|uniref:Uncharacterized protein n=1 Tax=Tieghemiomyces parasiticus TaxID=78921 RepID=A0A9W8AFI1_9FUNG|nr:hypothetical protein IWQ60_002081 [Tieghemiomyces parasiticus]
MTDFAPLASRAPPSTTPGISMAPFRPGLVSSPAAGGTVRPSRPSFTERIRRFRATHPTGPTAPHGDYTLAVFVRAAPVARTSPLPSGGTAAVTTTDTSPFPIASPSPLADAVYREMYARPRPGTTSGSNPPARDARRHSLSTHRGPNSAASRPAPHASAPSLKDVLREIEVSNHYLPSPEPTIPSTEPVPPSPEPVPPPPPAPAHRVLATLIVKLRLPPALVRAPPRPAPRVRSPTPAPVPRPSPAKRSREDRRAETSVGSDHRDAVDRQRQRRRLSNPSPPPSKSAGAATQAAPPTSSRSRNERRPRSSRSPVRSTADRNRRSDTPSRPRGRGDQDDERERDRDRDRDRTREREQEHVAARPRSTATAHGDDGSSDAERRPRRRPQDRPVSRDRAEVTPPRPTSRVSISDYQRRRATGESAPAAPVQPTKAAAPTTTPTRAAIPKPAPSRPATASTTSSYNPERSPVFVWGRLYKRSSVELEKHARGASQNRKVVLQAVQAAICFVMHYHAAGASVRVQHDLANWISSVGYLDYVLAISRKNDISAFVGLFQQLRAIILQHMAQLSQRQAQDALGSPGDSEALSQAVRNAHRYGQEARQRWLDGSALFNLRTLMTDFPGTWQLCRDGAAAADTAFTEYRQRLTSVVAHAPVTWPLSAYSTIPEVVGFIECVLFEYAHIHHLDFQEHQWPKS